MKKVAIILGVLLVLILFYLMNNGLLTSVKIIEKEIGPYTLVYGEHKGDYSKIVHVQKKIYETLAKDFKIKTTKGFGIFYDKPGTVPKEKMRSEGGCILEGKHNTKENIKKIKEKLKVKEYPKVKSITVDFPLKSKMSIIIGTIKVYPKLNKYMTKKGYKPAPALEVYDLVKGRTLYTFPVKK